MVRKTNRHTDRQTDKQTDGLIQRKGGRQKQPDIPADRQIDKAAGRREG